MVLAESSILWTSFDSESSLLVFRSCQCLSSFTLESWHRLHQTSWILILQKFWSAFRCVLKGSTSVTYPFKFYSLLLVAKRSPWSRSLFGIFAIYLQCSSNESRTRTANVVFYFICLLYISCATTVVGDLLDYTFSVSNNPTCKNIIFIISCTVSPYEYYRLNFKMTYTKY